MDVTFLVKINIQDVSQITSIAEDIADDLTSAGHDVASVVPWARPSLPTATNVIPNVPIPTLVPPPEPPTL